MGLFDGCLLACDVDGTLISNGILPPANLEKIKYFISEGGSFCLCSGRSVEGLVPIVRKLEGNVQYCVAQNGSVVYDFKNQKTLKAATLPEEDKHFVKYLCENMADTVAVKIYLADHSYTINRNVETDDHESSEELKTTFVTYNDIKDIKWCKVVIFPIDSEVYEEVVKLVPKEHNSNFVRTNAHVYGRMRNYFEQLPAGISKATSLEFLKDILKVKEGGLFGIGDYYNDVEMICFSDIGAATDEAPDDIKEKAQYVTCPCADGAVADFIDYLKQIKGE